MTTIGDEAAAAHLEVREGDYGEAIAAIEPGGAEFIPLRERHGRPTRLFWTWMSPNFEFATVFVGVLAVAAFGLTFGQAIAAIALGSVLGSATHGVLSARGPRYGVPQMVLSRVPFGYWGNILPAGLNSVTAGVGWFAVNSVSGGLALSSLLHLDKYLCLVIIVAVQILVALFGHNLVHAFEKVAFPVLAVAFVLGAVYTFRHGHLSAPKGGGGFAGFTLTLGATFGYAAGWNPYASDYTRYFAPDTSRAATGLWAGLGVALSCIFLETVGAASATVAGVDPFAGPSALVHPYPEAVRDLVLLAIAIGAVAANVLNIYSGSMSFVTLGLKLHVSLRRALAAGVFGVLGFVVAAVGMNNISEYENFLLIIAYWIGPWLAVVFVDQLMRRGNVASMLYDERHVNWAGPISMFLGMLVSIVLFANQQKYTGIVPRHVHSVGDLAFEVGFVVAGIAYALLFPLSSRRSVAATSAA
jgi:NCS1 nucleoside transporter family